MADTTGEYFEASFEGARVVLKIKVLSQGVTAFRHSNKAFPSGVSLEALL